MEDSVKKYSELMELAKGASEFAYAPYSNFSVGAAVLYESGNIYTGCNVENVSYSVGICAERNAISTAIAQGEKTPLTAVAVYSPNQKHCLPCGACLQWFSEFRRCCNSKYDIKIILENKDGGVVTYGISELLPHDFQMENK